MAIFLPNTSTKLQITTSADVSGMDVDVNYIDASSSTLAASGAGQQKSLITTAVTNSDILAVPGASTVRTLKGLTARNKDNSISPDVTIIKFDGTDHIELFKVNLNPNDVLEYIDTVGFFVVKASTNARVLANANTADVVASGADTYLTGANINLSGLLQAGTIIRQWGYATKTAAGIATAAFNVRCGTAGSTADTSVGSLSLGSAQTAATDTGIVWCETVIENAGASGSGKTSMEFLHKNATTGMASVSTPIIVQSTFSAVDLTVQNLKWGLSVNPGASGVWTFQLLGLEIINPKPSA